MNWAEFKHEVEQRLAEKPWLTPIFRDVHEIGRRIREVDDTLFIVRNHFYGRYEVHSTEHWPNTYAWTVPWRSLDERVIRRAIKNNLLARGDLIFEESDRINEQIKLANERKFRNDVDAAAREARSLFKPLAWEL